MPRATSPLPFRKAKTPTCGKPFCREVPRRSSISKANTEVRLQPVKAYPDYYPEKAGSHCRRPRARARQSSMGRGLGANFRRLAPAAAGIHLVRRHDGQPARYPASSQGRPLVALHAARAAACLAICAAAAARAAGHDAASGQCAGGAAVCFAACARRRYPVRNASVEQLLIEGDAVRGVRIKDSAGSRRIAARKGVVLATGGFSHDARTFASSFFPPERGWFPPRLPPGPATACMSRSPPAPASIPAWRAPPIGCRPRCSSARTAARAFSRIP